MSDREKVIKGLDSCAKWMGENDDDACGNGPYHPSHFSYDDNNCIAALNNDAIALLKEQAPHVLTLDEAVDGTQVYYVEFQYHLDRGWVKCDFNRMYVDGEVAMLFLRDKTFYQQKEHYGQLWRLWNRRPTDEQMKAVKWE